MGDTSLLFTLVARDKVSRTLRGVRSSLDATGTVATKLAAGLSAGIAPAGALGVAMLGTAASFASAGLAVGAFKAAAQPQLNAVTDAAEMYAKAQEAAKEGGEEAARAQQEYADALAEMTPATRDTAVAFIGLKEDFTAWSDSLSGSTMPVFTQGIGILRDMLPTLTPFVHAATSAFGGFLDRIETGIQSAAFKDWVSDMSTAAGPALESLLNIVGNVAVGMGGLLQAMLPVNSGMGDLTGSLEAGSAAFRDWATGLKGSEGFAEFSEHAATSASALGNIATAALNVLVALGPLLGTTVMLANGFAQVVSALPTPVLTTLAAVIGTVTIGMKLWAAAQLIVTAHNAIWTTSQWTLNAALFASPITWLVLGIAGLVAAIVLIATKTTWFQTAWNKAWGFIKRAVSVAFGWIKNNWPLVLGILTGPIGLAVTTIVRKWDSIVGFVKRLPGRISSAASGMWDGIKSAFRSALNWIISGWNGLSLTLPSVDTHIPGVGTVGGWTLSTPDIPYLAKGGIATRAGTAVVGERGPELLHMPRGAAVTPLPRGGGGGVVRVEINLTGADEDLKRRIRRMVRVEGRGNVQVAFGG